MGAEGGEKTDCGIGLVGCTDRAPSEQPPPWQPPWQRLESAEKPLPNFAAGGRGGVRDSLLRPVGFCLDGSACFQGSHSHGDPRGYKARYLGGRWLPRR